MSNLSSLVSLASSLLEVTQFAGDLLLLALGCSALSRLAELLYRFAKALTWLAELTLLLLALLLSALGDVAPVVGRHAGRWAGRTVRLGHQARALYAQHLAPVASALDQIARAFVITQCGDALPELRKAIAPSVAPQPSAPTVSPSPASLVPEVAPARTRRQLLQLARERHLPRYSRMSTAALAAALT